MPSEAERLAGERVIREIADRHAKVMRYDPIKNESYEEIIHFPEEGRCVACGTYTCDSFPPSNVDYAAVPNGILDGTRSAVNTILTPTELACLRGEHEADEDIGPPVASGVRNAKIWSAHVCKFCRALYVARGIE